MEYKHKDIYEYSNETINRAFGMMIEAQIQFLAEESGEEFYEKIPPLSQQEYAELVKFVEEEVDSDTQLFDEIDNAITDYVYAWFCKRDRGE